MAKRNEMFGLLEEEKEIMENRIIAEENGNLYVTPHDAAILNSAAAIEDGDTGMRTYNPDGSIASTGKRVHAINPDYFFSNKCKVKAKKLYVVCGARDADSFLAIMYGQKQGRLSVSSLPCYVIARNDEKKLFVEKVTTVSASEFISDFHTTLKHKDMAEILPLIFDSGDSDTAESMPI